MNCENVDKNSSCLYLSEIRQQRQDIQLIKKALLGDDLQGGIVAQIQKFKMFWNILLFLSGASVTGLITLAIALLK